jgi:hypothetical protein
MEKAYLADSVVDSVEDPAEVGLLLDPNMAPFQSVLYAEEDAELVVVRWVLPFLRRVVAVAAAAVVGIAEPRSSQEYPSAGPPGQAVELWVLRLLEQIDLEVLLHHQNQQSAGLPDPSAELGMLPLPLLCFVVMCFPPLSI